VKIRLLIACFLLTATGLIVAASDSQGLVVHEWGTFLAMNGSDGVSLDGMYHEEHALPPFVHARSKDQLRLPMSRLKGETPVIYFYTRDVMKATVEVDFPTGLWTQWYPQATAVSPGLVQVGSPLRTRDGRIAWDVVLRPANMKNGTLPATEKDALWNYARDVDAAYVSDSPEASEAPERFIFYRGLGEVPMPIDVRVADGRISATTAEPQGLHHLFVLRVENGRAAYTYTTRLGNGDRFDQPLPSMADALPIDQFAERISQDMAYWLTASGLYKPEAQAMVNTWKSSYFKTDGVRLLFVLPQAWTNRFIPMRIKPQPQELVRVMVGRVELLSPEREKRAERAISLLASPDASERDWAFETLQSEGRYVEPIIRRTLRTSTDERVLTLSRRLLLTDWVTELRTALTDATTGEKSPVMPVYLRAQLASLLREVGLNEEAKQHGESALAELAQMRQPTMSDHDSRHMFRALARAYEGAGNDRMALESYGKFVEFGSQSYRSPDQPKGVAFSDCIGCHNTIGPTDNSFFREWYAGRKFGEYAVKTGQAPRLIAAHESRLSDTPKNRASQMSLAYLYEASGQNAKAKDLWAKMDR